MIRNFVLCLCRRRPSVEPERNVSSRRIRFASALRNVPPPSLITRSHVVAAFTVRLHFLGPRCCVSPSCAAFLTVLSHRRRRRRSRWSVSRRNIDSENARLLVARDDDPFADRTAFAQHLSRSTATRARPEREEETRRAARCTIRASAVRSRETSGRDGRPKRVRRR